MGATDDVEDKLRRLQEATSPQHLAEVVAVYWPAPDGTRYYTVTPWEELPWFRGVFPLTPTELRIVSDRKAAPFIDLPRTASISDDSVQITFCDIDGEMSRLLFTHGAGVMAEVFEYYGSVDLLLSVWRGAVRSPKAVTRDRVQVELSAGFRSKDLLLPRRQHPTSCGLIFGGLLASQDQIKYMCGCPYNKHLEGQPGVVQIIGINDPSTGQPYTDCPRAVVGDCIARLVTKDYWPAFDVQPDPIANNQTRPPNLMASAQGNVSKLKDPIRAVIGERIVKALPLLAYRNETNTAHADKGFGAGVFEVCEGPIVALWDFYLNGVYVTSEHSNYRLGDLGQSPTFFSPNFNSLSGTAHVFGRIQGSFNSNQASSLTAQIHAKGLRNIRVYSDPATYAEQYTTNRMWALLEMLTNPRWGFGNGYEKYDIASAIDTASWCDQVVAMHDPNGNLLTGTRSTFNAELNGRAVQQQIEDLCTAGRIGLPFEWGGLDMFVPLRKEIIDDSIPVFTDEGQDCNIIHDGPRSSLSLSQISDADLTNEWTVTYDDMANGGVETQLIAGDQRQQLRAGRAYGDRSARVINKSLPAFGTTNFSEAARLLNFLLYLGPRDEGGIKNNLEVTFTTWYRHALTVRNYKLIRVLNTKLQHLALLSLGTAYEYFRVKKITRKGDLKVEVVCQVYPQDFYEQIESVTVPPPVFVSPGGPNPGGRIGEQPEPIGILDLTHSGDRVVGRFAPSVY
jgi:hypothetical protein